jgi:hypothetical protein
MRQRWILVPLLVVFAACDTKVPTTPAPVAVQPTASPVTSATLQPLGSPNPDLIEAGFPPEIAALFPTVTTDVVIDEPGHYRVRQDLPEAGEVRETEVLLTSITLEPPFDAVWLSTTRGINIYPLSMTGDSLPNGGFVFRTAFYIPPGELTDDELATLDPQPASAAASTIRLASFSGAGAPVPGGVLVEGAVAVSEGGSGSLGAPMARSSRVNVNFWENSTSSSSWQETIQNRRDVDFANRGVEWRANERRLARESAGAARLNTALSIGLAAWEAYNAVLDWWNADDQLTALSNCNNSTDNPLHRDQGEIDAANDRISDARNELRVNNIVRGANVLVTGTAGRIPGPIGAGITALTVGNEPMLSEAQANIMSGVSRSVAPCATTYLKLHVTYRYGLSFVNDPPERGLTNDKGVASDVFDGTVIVPFKNGAFGKNGEWGNFRHTESGSYDCVRYDDLTVGAAAARATASQDGFATPAPDAAAGTPPHPTYQIGISVEGHLLMTREKVIGFDHTDGGVEVCKALPDVVGQEGDASLGCTFTGVDIAAGGTYMDDSNYGTRTPGTTDSVTCRLVVTPLSEPPERDPTAPVPPEPR